MSDVNTAVSSPAPEATPTPAPSTLMLPTDSEFRKTGKPSAVEPKPKAESTPAQDSEPQGETESASEAATDKQEQKRSEPKPRSTADTRLRELLDDLKRAGLTPAELKSFKREAQRAEAEAPKAAEHTDKPKQPTYEDVHPKPKLEDFDSIEAHTEALTDWKLDKREFERNQREAAEAQSKAIREKLADANTRYGEGADASIRSAAKTIAESADVHPAVKSVLTDSAVLADVLYTLNSKEGELASFIQLAKENPNAAIRKAVLLEHLITQELSKGADSEPGTAQAERDESGKFVAQKPAKKVTEAPPPPREASGRNAAPPDDVTAASKTLDFTAYRNAQNRRDLARSQGRP